MTAHKDGTLLGAAPRGAAESDRARGVDHRRVSRGRVTKWLLRSCATEKTLRVGMARGLPIRRAGHSLGITDDLVMAE